jgi:hypothetical protein
VKRAREHQSTTRFFLNVPHARTLRTLIRMSGLDSTVTPPAILQVLHQQPVVVNPIAVDALRSEVIR